MLNDDFSGLIHQWPRVCGRSSARLAVVVVNVEEVGVILHERKTRKREWRLAHAVETKQGYHTQQQAARSARLAWGVGVCPIRKCGTVEVIAEEGSSHLGGVGHRFILFQNRFATVCV